MKTFRFLEIDRVSGDVKAEAPLVMDMVSNDKYNHVKQQLDDGIGCRVIGEHEMYQVPSKMFFATDRDMWLIKKLQQEAPDTYNKFSLEHFFYSFTFGDPSLQQEIVEHFAEYPEHTKLDMVSDLAEDAKNAILSQDGDPVHYNYYKYISVVPHIFVDTSTDDQVDFRSYSYAFTTNKKPAELQPELNMVMMIFEFSPVSMSITKSSQPLSRFIISICAIVGGVFVVFGLLNSSLLAVQKKARGTD